MLNIIIERTPERIRLVLRGHATGSSEACAAASAMAQTLGDYLGEQGERVHMERGWAEMEGPATEENALLFRVFCRGFRRLAATEPDRVRYQENGKV